MAPPRIIYEGDEPAAHRHLPVAQNLLHKVRSMVAASGAGVSGLSLAPEPGSFIYALKAGDLEVLHIFSEPPSAPELESFDVEVLPDILNGVTRDAQLKEFEVPDPQGQAVTLETLDSFKPNAETAKAYDRSGSGQWERLAVEPHPSINSSRDDPATQYNVVFASAYSGRMRKLVQVLLGYGRIGGRRAAGTPAEREEIATKGLRVMYDCRWHRCHLITEGADKKLWLVEISMSRGVLAMPLPLYEQKPDQDTDSMKAVVEEFDGLPTGQMFPSGDRLEQAITRGNVLQLATDVDLKDFYRLTPFSSALGWTTNTAGDEAHNTGWYWGDGGVRRSCHYRLLIRIGPLKQTREPEEPIADGQALLRPVSDTPFYHPSERKPPPFKVYEPLVDGLISVVMTAESPISVGRLPVCDSTLHVCYVDDQLKLVKYFWDRGAQKRTTVSDNYEPCMYIGSWYYEQKQHTAESAPTFYTTDFDHRSEAFDSVLRTDTVGTDMGRWVYHYQVDTTKSYAPQWGDLWRNRIYRQRSVSVLTGGKNTTAGIVVPRGLRDGYVYARFDYRGVEATTTTTTYSELTHPIVFTIYQYFYPEYKPEDECWVQFRYKVWAPQPANIYGCNEMLGTDQWTSRCADGEPSPGPSTPRTSTVTKQEPAKYTTSPTLVGAGERGSIALKVLSGTFDDAKRPEWERRSPDPDTGELQHYKAAFSVMGAFHIAYDDQLDVGDQKRIGPMVVNERSADYNFLGVL